MSRSLAQTLFNIQNHQNSNGYWTIQEFENEIGCSESRQFVWPDQKDPMGFVVYRFGVEEIWIMNLAVFNKGCGEGSKMLEAFLSSFKASQYKNFHLVLELEETNLAALRLYQSKSFEIVGRRVQYYKNGSAALVMKRKIII